MRHDHFVPTPDELLALKEEDAYVRDILEVDKKDTPSVTDRLLSIDEDYISLTDRETKSGKLSVEDKNYLKELHEKLNYYNLPLNLQKLLPGVDQSLPNSYVVPHDQIPDWFDERKYQIGQRFARKYFIGVNASEMLSVMILFTFPDILETLIYTGNSGSPYSAFRRYFHTVLKVTSWYENDIWKKGNPGYRNLRTVRAMHINVSKRMNSTPYKELESKISLVESSDKPAIWSDQEQVLFKDLQSACPFKMPSPFDRKRSGKIFINQLDMSVTQFAFVGLMVTYPEKFGASGATEEDLEGFLHLWRAIGYLLGIQDEYNFCSGSLEEIVERSHSVIDNWVKPNLQNVTEDWEHMSRCFTEGLTKVLPLVTFEPAIMYLCWVIEVPTTRLYRSLNWAQTFTFYFVKFLMNYTLRFPGMLPLHNWLLRFALARVAKMSPKQLKRLEKKKYEYQKKKDVVKRENKRSRAPLLTLVFTARLLI